MTPDRDKTLPTNVHEPLSSEGGILLPTQLNPANKRTLTFINELAKQAITRIRNPQMQDTNYNPQFDLNTVWESHDLRYPTGHVFNYNVRGITRGEKFSFTAKIDAQHLRVFYGDPSYVDLNEPYRRHNKGQLRIYSHRIQITWINYDDLKPQRRFATMTTELSKKQNGFVRAFVFWLQEETNQDLFQFEQCMIAGRVYKPNLSLLNQNSRAISVPFADESLTIPLLHNGTINRMLFV